MQISENSRRSRGFSPAREFTQTLPRFSTAYGGTDNMFYFFYEIMIFSLNKEKDEIRSAYCKFLQLGNSQPYCSRHFSALQCYENTLVDQSKRTYYPNYFIISNHTKVKQKPMNCIVWDCTRTRMGFNKHAFSSSGSLLKVF